MRSTSVIGLLLTATTAFAQQVVDDTGSQYGEKIAEEIASALIGSANDPYSAQIARLKPSTGSEDVICGLVNLKNGSGGYTGFQPFYFNVKTKSIAVEVSSGCR